MCAADPRQRTRILRICSYLRNNDKSVLVIKSETIHLRHELNACIQNGPHRRINTFNVAHEPLLLVNLEKAVDNAFVCAITMRLLLLLL